MKMLTKVNRKALPALYSTEEIELEDKIAQVKFFTPDGSWTWYAVEFDGDDRFFGWVIGMHNEWGDFLLSDLSTNKGPLGLSIERDMYFSPTKMSDLPEWKDGMNVKTEGDDQEERTDYPTLPLDLDQETEQIEAIEDDIHSKKCQKTRTYCENHRLDGMRYAGDETITDTLPLSQDDDLESGDMLKLLKLDGADLESRISKRGLIIEVIEEDIRIIRDKGGDLAEDEIAMLEMDLKYHRMILSDLRQQHNIE